MPTRTAPRTWALLGLFYVNLLLGNANVNAGQEMQQQAHNGEPQGFPETIQELSDDSEFPPDFLEYMTIPNYTFATVKKGGVDWYDLGGVQDTKLTIDENSDGVKGITASRGDCKVTSLHVTFPYLVDDDLFNNCPLRNLSLEGKLWRCVEEGRMLQQRGSVVDMRNATCVDAWHEKKKEHVTIRYSMEEGIRKLDEFGITKCSAERCACKWYFSGDSYSVNVHCEGVSLTDDTLPTLPSQVGMVRLQRNKLRSMDKLIKHLLPHNETLTVLVLDDNHLEVLPRLPHGSFPRLVHLMLERNKIEKIDIDAFKDLITRKELIIDLQDNKFPCDCLLYRFKVFLQKEYMHHWTSLKSYMNMTCKYNDPNKTTQYLHALTEDLCNPWREWPDEYMWLLLNASLALLNLAVIGMMLDLTDILVYRKARRPVMDRVVCAFQCVLCFWWQVPVAHVED